MALANDLAFVVEKLNAPPFEMHLSLVAFDEKSNLELMEIMTKVLSQLGPEHDANVREETVEQTADRISDVLFRILNYKQPLPPHVFKENLMRGDWAVVCPLLVWMLQRLPELQMRAYLARFLVNIDVPEHLLNGDDEVMEVYAQYKEVQEDFKAVHKEVEKNKLQLVPPAEIKRAITAMEEDKDQLERKIADMHSKLESSAGFADMLREIQQLRVEHEEALRLQERQREQRLAYAAVESQMTTLKAELSARKGVESRERDPRKLLSKLEDDVEALNHKVAEELPRAIAARQKRFEELQDLLAMPIGSEQSIRELMGQRAQLQRTVADLEARKKATMNDPEDKLAMFRQQATLQARKRDQLEQRLQRLSHERASIDTELAAKATQLEAIKDKPVLKGDDLKKYASELRTKTAQFKRMKAELTGFQTEWGVLSRTEAILREIDDGVSNKLRQLEVTHGVSGLVAKEEELQNLSQEKADVDAAKGRTLEEISAVVEKTMSEIKENKARLMPQIEELRTLRSSFQHFESKYSEKKMAYDSVKAGVDSDVAKLQAELDAEQKDAQQEESTCYLYESLLAIEAIKMARVEAEKAGQALERQLPDGSVIRTYQELYQQKLSEQERAQKELRDRQRDLKENNEPNKVQMRLFRDLSSLLRCKVELQQRARAESSSLAEAEGQVSNVLSLSD